MSRAASFIDGFFDGVEIRQGWEDKKRKRKQDDEDREWTRYEREQQRKADEHTDYTRRRQIEKDRREDEFYNAEQAALKDASAAASSGTSSTAEKVAGVGETSRRGISKPDAPKADTTPRVSSSGSTAKEPSPQADKAPPTSSRRSMSDAGRAPLTMPEAPQSRSADMIPRPEGAPALSYGPGTAAPSTAPQAPQAPAAPQVTDDMRERPSQGMHGEDQYRSPRRAIVDTRPADQAPQDRARPTVQQPNERTGRFTAVVERAAESPKFGRDRAAQMEGYRRIAAAGDTAEAALAKGVDPRDGQPLTDETRAEMLAYISNVERKLRVFVEHPGRSEFGPQEVTPARRAMQATEAAAGQQAAQLDAPATPGMAAPAVAAPYAPQQAAAPSMAAPAAPGTPYRRQMASPADIPLSRGTPAQPAAPAAPVAPAMAAPAAPPAPTADAAPTAPAREPGQATPAANPVQIAATGNPDALDAAAAQTPPPPSAEVAAATTTETRREMPISTQSPERIRAVRDHASKSFMERYASEGAPKMVEFYLSQGKPEKAAAYQQFIERTETKEAMSAWAEGVFAASVGDDQGFIDGMVRAYNTAGYFDDGYEAVPEESGIQRDEAGNVSGSITFRNIETGETFSQVIDQEADLYTIGAFLMGPENVFEQGWAQVEAAQGRRAADIDRQVELEDKMALETHKARLRSQGASDSDLARYEAAYEFLNESDGEFFQLSAEEQEAKVYDYLAQWDERGNRRTVQTQPGAGAPAFLKY